MLIRAVFVQFMCVLAKILHLPIMFFDNHDHSGCLGMAVQLCSSIQTHLGHYHILTLLLTVRLNYL